VIPDRAQPVVIRLPGAPELTARVDAADRAGVTLVLAVPPEGALRDTSAVIEYHSPTGVHRITGALASDRRDPAVLRLRRDDEQTVQRREWARVDAVVPVDVRFEDHAAGLAATVTLNVSGGGALIRDPVGLAIGTAVRLELRLGGVPIAATGRVVRAEADEVKGVVLDAIGFADREQIVRFVTDRQRMAMRIRRALL
jgi:hypothetical protein